MKIVPVTDASFAPYGRIVEGYPVEPMLKALAETPLGDAVEYVGKVESLHAVENADYLGERMFGGMPFQLLQWSQHQAELPGVSSRQRVQSGHSGLHPLARQAG